MKFEEKVEQSNFTKKKKKKIENKEAERKVLKDVTSYSVITFKLCND